MIRNIMLKKRFLSPMIDEVSLHQRAAKVLRDESNFSTITKRYKGDVDLLTSILYHKITGSKHKLFIDRLNAMPSSPVKSNSAIKILIVPGFFYEDCPDVGADGKLVKQILDQNGFESEIIRVDGLGTVKRNSQIILKSILEQTHSKLWVLSISKGTLDMRYCLQVHGSDQLGGKIAGWVSFSGIFSGSKLAEIRCNSLLKKWLLMMICQLMRLDFEVIRELSCAHPYWQCSTDFLGDIELIHMIGFPLASHIQHPLAHRYHQLAQYGPTDGVISLEETLRIPGNIYPMWGADHFSRNPGVSQLVYKLCHYINRNEAWQ